MDDLIINADEESDSIETSENRSLEEKSDSTEVADNRSFLKHLTKHVPQPKAKHLLYTTAIGFVLGCVLTLSLVFAISDIINPEPVVDSTEPTIFVTPDDDVTLTVTVVEDVLKPTAALITNQYRYTAADIYDDYKKFFGLNLPFTNSKAVFTFKGTMSIGLDLQAISYEIDNDKKIIHIQLPKIGILSHDIDLGSFQFPFEEESIFNPKEMSDYVGALDQLKTKQAQMVLEDKEYMSTALNNTKEVLRAFLANSELTKDYTVTFSTTEVS